jgi:hypothetical protein
MELKSNQSCFHLKKRSKLPKAAQIQPKTQKVYPGSPKSLSHAVNAVRSQVRMKK